MINKDVFNNVKNILFALLDSRTTSSYKTSSFK